MEEAKATLKSSPLDRQVDGEHYVNRAIQPVEFIVSNKLQFIEGNVVKYITRWEEKGGYADLDKVIHYVELLRWLHEKYHGRIEDGTNSKEFRDRLVEIEQG